MSIFDLPMFRRPLSPHAKVTRGPVNSLFVPITLAVVENRKMNRPVRRCVIGAVRLKTGERINLHLPVSI